MSIPSRKFVGPSVLVIFSVGLAVACLMLWPKPMSIILAGIAMLCDIGALLIFCNDAERALVNQARRAVFLASGSFGLAFLGLAWKYHKTASAFSSASLLAAGLLGLGAIATAVITRSKP